MNNNDQYVRLAPRDWRRRLIDAGATLEESGLYYSISMWMMETGQPIPANDHRQAARRLAIDPRTYKRVLQSLIKKDLLFIAQGYIIDEAVQAEIDRARQIAAARAKAGRKSGMVRSRKMTPEERVERAMQQAIDDLPEGMTSDQIAEKLRSVVDTISTALMPEVSKKPNEINEKAEQASQTGTYGQKSKNSSMKSTALAEQNRKSSNAVENPVDKSANRNFRAEVNPEVSEKVNEINGGAQNLFEQTPQNSTYGQKSKNSSMKSTASPEQTPEIPENGLDKTANHHFQGEVTPEVSKKPNEINGGAQNLFEQNAQNGTCGEKFEKNPMKSTENAEQSENPSRGRARADYLNNNLEEERVGKGCCLTESIGSNAREDSKQKQQQQRQQRQAPPEIDPCHQSPWVDRETADKIAEMQADAFAPIEGFRNAEVPVRWLGEQINPMVPDYYNARRFILGEIEVYGSEVVRTAIHECMQAIRLGDGPSKGGSMGQYVRGFVRSTAKGEGVLPQGRSEAGSQQRGRKRARKSGLDALDAQFLPKKT